VHRLLYEGTGGVQTIAKEINVGIFGPNSDRVAIVFRDETKGNIGRILVGHVREAGRADMAPPEQFTGFGAKAYHPVVTGADEENRVLIAWRDEFRQGEAWVRAASLGTSGVRGADLDLDWSEQVLLGTDQANKMAVVPLPGNRAVVLFSDKVPATLHALADPFGHAVLVELIGPHGDSVTQVNIINRVRFFQGAICRLEVTKTSDRSFVIAGRAQPLEASDDDEDKPTYQQEAIAIYGRMEGDDLVFNPEPWNLEKNHAGVWARGISLIDANTIAYAYQHVEEGTSGFTSSIKMAVATLDPELDRFSPKLNSTSIMPAFSPYVQMLSVPYTAHDPHTLTYFEHEGKSKVHVCKWTGSMLESCEDMVWFPQKVTSVSGVHLGGGKSFMTFTSESGTPYYSVFGLSKK
jgi:hypothetical protein